jgi:hypothetical protein
VKRRAQRAIRHVELDDHGEGRRALGRGGVEHLELGGVVHDDGEVRATGGQVGERARVAPLDHRVREQEAAQALLVEERCLRGRVGHEGHAPGGRRARDAPQELGRAHRLGRDAERLAGALGDPEEEPDVALEGVEIHERARTRLVAQRAAKATRELDAPSRGGARDRQAPGPRSSS